MDVCDVIRAEGVYDIIYDESIWSRSGSPVLSGFRLTRKCNKQMRSNYSSELFTMSKRCVFTSMKGCVGPHPKTEEEADFVFNYRILLLTFHL